MFTPLRSITASFPDSVGRTLERAGVVYDQDLVDRIGAARSRGTRKAWVPRVVRALACQRIRSLMLAGAVISSTRSAETNARTPHTLNLCVVVRFMHLGVTRGLARALLNYPRLDVVKSMRFIVAALTCHYTRSAHSPSSG